MVLFFSFFFFFGLCWVCAWALSNCSDQELLLVLLVAVEGLLIVVASLVAEHGI